MTVPQESYSELKKRTDAEFTRETLLYNLEKLNYNVRACARKMRCSPHTVYLALKKKREKNLKDASHKPKNGHPPYALREQGEYHYPLSKKYRIWQEKDALPYHARGEDEYSKVYHQLLNFLRVKIAFLPKSFY